MTLLQTRVDERVAIQFARAAARRGVSPYKLLAELVASVAVATQIEPAGWEDHQKQLAGIKIKRIAGNAVAHERAAQDER